MRKMNDFKKYVEEARYRKGILEAILVSSITEERYELPTIQEFVLSELVNGTIEYIGGDPGKVNYQRFRQGTFERCLWGYYEEEIKLYSKGKLNPKIREAITKMVNYDIVDPSGPDRPYPKTELYTFFKGSMGGGICGVIMKSTFSLPQEITDKVKREIIPTLSNTERKTVEGIGKSMRKYIDEDLEFIKGRYRW